MFLLLLLLLLDVDNPALAQTLGTDGTTRKPASAKQAVAGIRRCVGLAWAWIMEQEGLKTHANTARLTQRGAGEPRCSKHTDNLIR